MTLNVQNGLLALALFFTAVSLGLVIDASSSFNRHARLSRLGWGMIYAAGAIWALWAALGGKP